MRLSAGAASDRGPRPSNQDAHFVDLSLGLLVVADGMGGHNAGEVASRMAVDAVVDFIRATHAGASITWPFPFNPEQSLSHNRIDAALRLANQRVHEAGEREAEQAGMGTTIVAILIDQERVVIGHAGDSRAYVLRSGQLVQLTQDHTWLNAIEEEYEELRNHPLRHVLTNGIGMGEDLVPSLLEDDIHAGERFLLCTDGVHGSLERATLQRIVTGSSPDAAAQEVVHCALRAGTNDNATAVVLNVD